MQRFKPLHLIFVALVYAATASAQLPETSAKVTVGDIVLIVPPIKGFRFPTERERGIFVSVATFIVPKNRLLAALFTDADLRQFAGGRDPELNDYFALQTPRSLESRAVTLEEFQPLRREIREQDRSARIRISPTVSRQLAEASKQASNRAGAKITINITEPISLGVFEDTERSIGVTLLSRVRADANEARTEDLMLSATIATIVRGKFLYLSGACTFHSMNDVSRCNSQVKLWLTALHAANP